MCGEGKQKGLRERRNIWLVMFRKMVFEQRPKRSKIETYKELRKNIPSRGTGKCKGPEAGVHEEQQRELQG